MSIDRLPSSFSSQQTALRLREVMKRFSSNTITEEVPRKLTGRVISVDLPRLRGTVWFAGDDQPTQVSIFADAVPAQWATQAGFAGIDSTSTSGAGSQVVCERLNGTLYITKVLTGGQAALDIKTLNQGYLLQEAADTVAGGPTANAATDIVGDPFESVFNLHVYNTALLDGEAIEFGPFTTWDPGTPSTGMMELSITVEGCTRLYRVVTNPKDEYDHPSLANQARPSPWFKVLPYQVATYHEGGATPFSKMTVFELGITLRKTSYGNTDQFSTYKEIWFRLIRVKSINSTGMDAKIAMRATNVQKARSLGGRELFMMERNVSPEINIGTIGFDNASNIFGQYVTTYCKDTFGRTVTPGGWGKLDWFSNWIITSGTATDYYVDGTNGVISISANNSPYEIGPNQATAVPTFDTYITVVTAAVTTGAKVQVGLTNAISPISLNEYQWLIDLRTDGAIDMSFRKRISGTVSLIGTSTATGLTYTTGTRINLRFQQESNASATTMRGKAWLDGTVEPEAWLKDITDTTMVSLTGIQNLYAIADTGNTNAKPYLVKFDKFNSINGRYSGSTIPPETWHNGPWRSGILRAANDIQKTWTCDGQFTWTGTNLKWTGNIYLSGIGRNVDILKYGKATVAFISQETSALLYKVPMDPSNADPFFNFISFNPANGIPLAANQSLWCGIPPGTGWDNLFPYLFVVDSSVQLEYELPEWAVLIAARGPSGVLPEIRLGNGESLDKWRALTLQNGWANRGAGFPPAEYRMRGTDTVDYVINITGGTTTPGTTICNFPVGFRPTVQLVLPSFNHLLAVDSTGDLKVFSSNSATMQLTGSYFLV